MPLPLLTGWTHGYAPFGAPLLDGTAPEAALAGLLAAPGALGLPPRLLLPNAPADGPLPELLAARGGRRAAYWPHDRGLLDLTGLGPEARAAYLGHLSGQRRRKLRRARARLEAAGPVTFDILAAPDALGPALEAHVALEAAGWKGRPARAWRSGRRRSRSCAPRWPISVPISGPIAGPRTACGSRACAGATGSWPP